MMKKLSTFSILEIYQAASAEKKQRGFARSSLILLPFSKALQLKGKVMSRERNKKKGKRRDQAIRPQVIAALENDKWDYRTIQGIANELHISPEKVRAIVTSDNAIRQSVMRDSKGRRLYTTKKRKSAFGDYFSAFRAVNAAKMER
ncbi:hypothetical protein [Pseudoalteromonas sp. G24-MNA-CIBAN-0072]|uniref:hypothetical protein n=1 Tax=Pseudoalteromonas sp. G24-MNA-CIBAN-0072 TaxID=3140418 RepID=UPI00331F51D1